MSSKLLGLAVVAGAMALLAPRALADDMPRYERGEAFIFDNGRVELVHKVDGERVTWAARSGRTYVRDRNPVTPILEWSYRGQEGKRIIKGQPEELWPLKAGKRVQFRAVNETIDDKKKLRRSVHLWTCSTGRMEMLKVPAGRFEAYPITCDRYSPSSMKVVERLVWHYSPDVEHYVRREARSMSSGKRETYSLYAAVPPLASNPVRLEALARQATGREVASASRS